MLDQQASPSPVGPSVHLPIISRCPAGQRSLPASPPLRLPHRLACLLSGSRTSSPSIQDPGGRPDPDPGAHGSPRGPRPSTHGAPWFRGGGSAPGAAQGLPTPGPPRAGMRDRRGLTSPAGRMGRGEGWSRPRACRRHPHSALSPLRSDPSRAMETVTRGAARRPHGTSCRRKGPWPSRAGVGAEPGPGGGPGRWADRVGRGIGPCAPLCLHPAQWRPWTPRLSSPGPSVSPPSPQPPLPAPTCQ